MRVAVYPELIASIAGAVIDGGGTISEPGTADAMVWTGVADADRLAEALLPRHRWVALLTAGTDAWQQAGVVDRARAWTCAHGVYSAAVAEHATAGILAFSRRLFDAGRQQAWKPLPGRRLAHSTVTVVGTGTIGREIVRALTPFGPRLVGVNRTGRAVTGFADCLPVGSLPDALKLGDYIVLALPLNSESRHLLDTATLGYVRSHAYLINVARGQIVDTEALVVALTSGRIAGALLDVTEPEPLPADHPLWTLPNVIITGHVANPNNGRPWDTHQQEVAEHVRTNVKAFVAGRRLQGLLTCDA